MNSEAMKFSSLDQPLFGGTIKGDLVEYLDFVADRFVPVLAGRPSYDPTERHPRYLFRREARGNVTVERVGSTAFPRFRMKHRLANYLAYVALAAARAMTIRADLALAMTDPPFEGIFGAAVARLRGLPFVYNIQDLYPEMAVGGGLVRPAGSGGLSRSAARARSQRLRHDRPLLRRCRRDRPAARLLTGGVCRGRL